MSKYTDVRQDPAWRLLTSKYYIHTVRSATINPERAKTRGLSMIEAADLDGGIRVSVTPMTMLTYIKNGGEIVFEDPFKAKEVYDLILDLQVDWMQVFEESVHPPFVSPKAEEAFQLLGQLLEMIYPKVRQAIAGNIRNPKASFFAGVHRRTVAKAAKNDIDKRITAIPTEHHDVMAVLNQQIEQSNF